MSVLLPPHDPERHDHQEPPGAGVGYWGKQVAKLMALSAAHGELLNTEEAAAFLGMSRQQVQVMAGRGIFRQFPAGRHNFYPLSDLRAYNDHRREHGPARGGRGVKLPRRAEVLA